MVSVHTVNPILYDPFLWARLLDEDTITSDDREMCPNVKTKLITIPSFEASQLCGSESRMQTHNAPSVVCAAFSGGYGLLSLTTGELLRWCSHTKTFVPIRIVLSTSGDINEVWEVRSVFLGPGGVHGLITFTTGDVGYVNQTDNICYTLPALRNISINCVGWNTWLPSSLTTTNEFLLGTTEGLVYSVVITNGKESNVELLISFGVPTVLKNIVILCGRGASKDEVNTEDKINHLSKLGGTSVYEDESVAGSAQRNAAYNPLCVLLTTPTHIYKFTGRSTLKSVFEHVLSDGSMKDVGLMERESRKMSKITLNRPYGDSVGRMGPQRFSSPFRHVMWYGAPGQKESQKTTSASLENFILFEFPPSINVIDTLTSMVVTLKEKHNTAPHMSTSALLKRQMQKVCPFAQGTAESYLIWWVTGTGVLISSLLPLYSSTADISETRTVYDYQMDSEPAWIEFPTEAQICCGGSKDKTKPFLIRSSEASRFRLRTEQSAEMDYFSKTGLVKDTHNRLGNCLGMALTSFHMFLLFQTDLLLISRITNTQVQCIPLPAVRYGIVSRLILDEESDMVFLLTDRFLFRLYLFGEYECVWVQHLLSNNLSFPFHTLPISHSVFEFLRYEYGEALLREQNWSTGAQVILNSSIPLEDLFFKFFKHYPGNNNALSSLITALISKLRVDYQINKYGTFGTLSRGATASHEYRSHRYLMALQLWEVVELTHCLNQVELDIERLKIGRNTLADWYRTRGVAHLRGDDEEAETGRNRCDGEQRFDQNMLKQQVCTGTEQMIQRMSGLLSKKIGYRKTLLDSINLLMTQLQHYSSALVGDALFACFEHLGRPTEKLAWATLIGHQEIQVVECICQDNYASALIRLAQDPPVRRDAPIDGDSVDTTCQTWREEQLYLLAKFGPLLFAHDPSRLAVFLLEPQSLTKSTSTQFLDFLHEKIGENSNTIDFLLPTLLGVASPSLYQYTALHRCEALRIIDKFFGLLDFNRGKMKNILMSDNPVCFPLSRWTVSEWTGINGLWNLFLCILVSAKDEEDTIVERVSQLALNLQAHPTLKFDLFFSLRFCVERNQIRVVILILTLLQMYHNAVDIALRTRDLFWAKLVIDQIPHTSHTTGLPLKRRLWKRIARVAVKTMSASCLMSLLTASNGVFRIHEYLEFFTDSSVGAAYRKVLWKEFDRCEQRIRQKQLSIQRTQKAIESMKLCLKAQNAQPIMEMSGTKRLCFVCQLPAECDRFYVFPCFHVLHAVCAHNLIYPFMDEREREAYHGHVTLLRQHITMYRDTNAPPSNHPDKHTPTSDTTYPMTDSQAQQLHSIEMEIDNVLASECPLCGNWLIKTISVPFLHQDETVTRGATEQDAPQTSSSTQRRLSQVWMISAGPLPASKIASPSFF